MAVMKNHILMVGQSHKVFSSCMAQEHLTVSGILSPEKIQNFCGCLPAPTESKRKKKKKKVLKYVAHS